jgi:hypothetical protein
MCKNFKRWIKSLLQNPVYGPKAAVGISTRIEPVTVELAIYFVGFDYLKCKLALSKITAFNTGCL